MNKVFQKSILIMFIFGMTANGLNYVFQVLAARLLGVEAYGVISYFMSLLVVLSVPANSVRMFVSKYTAEYKSNIDSYNCFLFQMAKKVIVYALMYLFLGVIFNCFDLISGNKQDTYMFLVFGIAAVTIVQGFVMGAAQGGQNFIVYALISQVMAIIKVSGVFLADKIKQMDQIKIVLISILAGTIVSSVVGFMLLKRRENYFIIPDQRSQKRNINYSISYGISVMLLNLCVTFMMNVDLLVIAWFYSKYISGLYSSAMLFGRIINYAAVTIIGTMFPFAAKQASLGEQTKALYLKALLICIGIIMIIMIPVSFYSELLIKLVFGNGFADGRGFLFYSGLIASAVVLNTLNMNYLLALGKVRQICVSFPLGCLIGVIYSLFFHDSIYPLLIGIFILLTIVFFIHFIQILLSE